MTDADNDPVRIAVVGSGPAGFYAAGHLLKESDVEVDMFERLPTPHGLVRSGVAPDHPKIKTVTRVYEKTAAHPRFRFFGNVELGRDVSADELREHYHAVVYAVGAAADRPLGIPGEGLPGSWAATDFVGWYNGHPDYRDLQFDLSCERAVVVGNGNVALDVARMLTLDHSELALTDVADHALQALRESAVREVIVVGRRGPAQAAFTNPELLELGEMAGVDVVVFGEELERALAVADPDVDPTSERNVKVLREYARRPPRGQPRRIVLRFLLSPLELIADPADGVAAVKLVRNELIAGPEGTLRASATEARETIDARLVLRAVGYRGKALPGVPFDERRGVIPNEGGRVHEGEDGREAAAGPEADGGPGADGITEADGSTGADGGPGAGAARRGEYVVGWIKRGPSGVIGTNKKDAQETVDAILADLAAGALPAPASPDPQVIEELLHERRPDLVTYEGWSEIDRHERSLGEPHGRPRVKLTRIEEMLRVATEQSSISL
jgi:ferredoxin/flavodoxin---NADP+ reductase